MYFMYCLFLMEIKLNLEPFDFWLTIVNSLVSYRQDDHSCHDYPYHSVVGGECGMKGVEGKWQDKHQHTLISGMCEHWGTVFILNIMWMVHNQPYHKVVLGVVGRKGRGVVEAGWRGRGRASRDTSTNIPSYWVMYGNWPTVMPNIWENGTWSPIP